MGLFDSIGQKFSNMDDSQKKGLALGLASGFAGMSGNPNTNSIMAGIAGQQEALRDDRKAKQAADLLKSQNSNVMASMAAAGVDKNLLEMAKGNPALLKSLMNSFTDAKLNPAKPFAKQYSTPRVDEATGKVYVVVSDGNTGTVENIEVKDATGLTTQGKQDILGASDLKNQDIAKAQEVGQQAFGQMEAMQSVIRELENAKKMVVEGGASTGIMQKYIPSFDAATSEFRAISNRLGIAVISTATFGALSEGELKLAMETGFPQDLQGPELITWIDAKIAAQTKMKNSLYSKARSLTNGMRYSTFIQNHGYKDGNNPNATVLTPAQQELKNRGL